MTAGLPELLRQRLRAQADLIAALTSHPLLVGAGREDALAELFRQFMPRRFEILQGTVAVVDENRRPTRSTNQLDMIVADTMDFPLLLRSGNIAVVISQSVRGIIEVKSNLRRGAKFISSLVQISRARQLLESTDPVFTGLFSFGAPTYPETLRDWLSDVVALRELLETNHGDPSSIKLRDVLLRDEDIGVGDEEALLETLHNDNLPNIVAADRGAIARKAAGPSTAAFYTFLRGTNEMPPIVVLIDQFVKQLAATAMPAVHGALAVLRAHFLVDALPAPDLADLELPGSASASLVAK